jgi:predicted metal-binding membrane protein
VSTVARPRPAGRLAPEVQYRLPAVIPAAIAGAWCVAVVAQVSGNAALLHHDALIHASLPLWVALGLFLLAWQAMTAAMMLPSSLPMVRLFGAASAGVDSRGRTMAAFLAGYGAVWTAFGALAFCGDVALHRLVDATPGLAARPWLVGGVVIAGAGLFQFSSLKDRCIEECRHPAAMLLRRYRRGTAEAFRLGRDHGVFCLGCCWALMLLMFAAGVANLAWMGALTAVMVYEKVGRHGRRLATGVGVGLLAWSALVLAHPAWLPAAVAGIS